MAINKNEQSLIEFVTKLRQLNDIDVAIPQENIDEIVKNPEQYALDFIEAVFAQYVNTFTKSYKLGDNFGKEVMKNA